MSIGTPSSALFPPELLEQPIAARISYFERKIVAHRLLKEVHQELLHAIRYPSGLSLILVFGPPGVGKTTLRIRIENQLIEDARNDPMANPGHIAVLGLEVPSPDSGRFVWKDFYTRACEAMDEPMLEDKIVYDERGMNRDLQGRLIIDQRAITATALRRVFEKTVSYRQPRALIFDEAQHFNKIAGGGSLLGQMDTHKSLANMTNTVHVFIGTYDLLKMTRLSSQLGRRIIPIHFPRYRADQEKDPEEFEKVLRTLQRNLPLPDQSDLVSRCEYFYERSLGCIGILKDWLTRALSDALEHDELTLTPKCLEKHALQRGTLEYMMVAVIQGEEAVQKNQQGSGTLRSLLKLERITTPPPPNPEQPPVSQPAPADSSTSLKKGRNRVGQRRPKRDPVGRE